MGKQRAREKVVKFIRSLLVKYSTFSLFRCLSSSWRPFIFEPGAHPSSEIKETGPRERAITNRYSLFPRGGGGRGGGGEDDTRWPVCKHSSLRVLLPARACSFPTFPRINILEGVQLSQPRFFYPTYVRSVLSTALFSNWRNGALRVEKEKGRCRSRYFNG